MRPSPPLLALGLALGATAGWFLPRPFPADLLAPSSSLPAPSSPAWSWRDSPTPPSLAPDTVGPALAAWRALRSADGSPAPYATRADALRTLLVRLPADGFPRLLTSLTPAETHADRRLRQLAFDAWCETDAPAATRWAASAGKELSAFAQQAMRTWAALDAPAAAAWACALPDAETAAYLAAPALAALAETDPSRALALAASRDDAFRAAVLPKLFDTLAKADPAATLQAHGAAVWKNGDGFWQIKAHLQAWTRRDPDAALAWIAAQSNPRSSQIGSWLGHLATTPDERRALLDALARNPSFPQHADAIAGMLSQGDPAKSAEALAWLDTHADPALRLDVLQTLSRRFDSEHAEQNLPFALALPPSQNRTEAVARMLSAWTKVNPTAALAWIQTQDDPGVSAAGAAVQAGLLADIARSEPATALAEWSALSDPRAQKAAIRPIAEAWGKTDPAAALQWAVAQQTALDPQQRVNPPVQLIYSWAQKDPEAALRWAETYIAAAPPELNSWLSSQVLAAFGGNWNDKAPRAATADLYSKIHDPALRARALETHVREWLTKDPAAAKTWLEKSSAFTPEQAAALLAPAAK